MPELARHPDDVLALGDEEAGKGVAQVVEAQGRAVLAVELRPLHRPLESPPRNALVEPSSVARGEDVIGLGSKRGA